MPKIQIDGLDFNTEDLSEIGKAKFTSLQFLEQRLAILRNQKAIYQTAKKTLEQEIIKRLKSKEREEENE